jgi:threonyl-tRNA synthetase
MLKLFPDIKMAMGPATDDGFYFDFDSGHYKISEDSFPKIEQEMRKIIKADLALIPNTISVTEARKLFQDNPYKQEWLDEIAKRKEKATLYRTGQDFVDLCAGPHLKSTGQIVAFKLLSVAGAYWHGDEKNKMLTRIYGTAFPTQKKLEHYLWQQEEAKKRDHRKLGAKLQLWTFSEKVGAGLPLFTAKGALIRQLINDFIRNLQSKQGVEEVWTPQIAKAELFKISGHYDKYRENMFMVKSNYSQEEFFLKPMNCPQHTQIYASQPRSYKDLPIRMADFAMLYRDEKPGELNGLIRTRSFSQDDCHIFCREDQVIEEMKQVMLMTKTIMDTYGFVYKYRLSTRDPANLDKYYGAEENWVKAEKMAREIFETMNIEYFIGEGEAAFYAPKLDLIATDSLDREWQLSTLQIDYVMPQRFHLTYIDDKGKEQTPVMLHRAISGSPERLIGILLEHYSGNLPVWLSPVQAKIIPIAERHNTYGQTVAKRLGQLDIRVEFDKRQESMQKKLKEAEEMKIPYMLIIGDQEVTAKSLAIRQRGAKNLGPMSLEKFVQKIQKEIENKSQI